MSASQVVAYTTTPQDWYLQENLHVFISFLIWSDNNPRISAHSAGNNSVTANGRCLLFKQETYLKKEESFRLHNMHASKVGFVYSPQHIQQLSLVCMIPALLLSLPQISDLLPTPMTETVLIVASVQGEANFRACFISESKGNTSKD